MTKRIFVCADNHWGHPGVCKFENNGKKDRPWTDPEEMNKDMIALWNDTVGEHDRVYCLGDWSMKREFIKIAAQLKGKKVLVKGNHDIFNLEDYTPYFEDIRAYVVGGVVGSGCRYIMSHIPIHPQSLSRFDVNIHGHLHVQRVKKENGELDLRYVCVSMEQIDFKPILLDTVLEASKKAREFERLNDENKFGYYDQ